MILTEEEAKTKWCPDARASNGKTAVGTTVNRVDGGKVDPDCRCIGSACMAWRWREDLIEKGRLSGAYNKPDVFGYSTTHGYCGKAGKA